MTVRRYQKGDERQIQSLFKKTFNYQRSIEEWEWKFKKKPEHTEPFILVFEEDCKIIGHISLWVENAFMNGRLAKIGIRVDTMVDPDARGKGVYKKLNEALLEEASHEGIVYLYGFPAAKAKELFIKYTGANHITDMPRWIRVQNPITVLARKFTFLKPAKPLDRLYTRRKKINWSGYDLCSVNECREEFDELAEQAKFMEEALIVRDASYLNWRFLQHPVHTYHLLALYKDGKLRGYVVTHKEKTTITKAMIIDWLAIDDYDWTLLMDAAMKDLEDADIIQSWALKQTQAAKAMKNNGFFHRDNPLPFVGLAIEDAYQKMSKPDKWFITPGDVDSF